MTEIEQLQQAVAALEAQRAILGSAVVDAMLAPAREKLAALQAQAAPDTQQRKQVTVLFADVSGFTAMSETLDAEVVTEIMNALWARLDSAIILQGGQIDKHIGDAVMALWGVAAAREDDPERAIRAALAMQGALAAFRTERQVALAMRIGLNTGPVLLGAVGSTHEFTAMGDAVNLASRLEHAAPVGGILISHDTYRQVRGVFDVQPQVPLTVKGKAAPVQTYIVQQAKPRAFRMGARGVEGIETHMVGREAELLALQSAYADAVSGETRLALVVGDAGVGKSRLLFEFENWVDLRPETVYFFKGRAAPPLQSVVYGLWRDLFAFRFDILDTDSAATALDKFRAGMAECLPPERADLVGHMVGFDFSASPAVHNLLGSANFGLLAQADLIQYIRAMVERQPVVIFLEDLHWADDGSLDLVAHLLTALPAARLLLVGLTRPVLFERRHQWGEGQTALTRLDLKPLSRRASRTLIDEILQKLTVIPEALRNLVVEGAEGNPFYLEELVKMLIDGGIIERGADDQAAWRVNLERLKQTHLPSTLTGLLQARLDGLPQPEREVLQRASVVGRIFWDAAVADLAEMERAEVGAVLTAIRGRELIYWRERSAFAGTGEFLFKHALLRDAAYETVLLKLRKTYHARVARWLEAHAGERIGEYAGLIADHLERAGRAEPAARYLRQAAEKALTAGALRDALEASRRALALLPDNSPDRALVQVLLGRVHCCLGDYGAARRQLEAALALAQARGEHHLCVSVLKELGLIAREQGDFAQATAHLERGLRLAHQVEDRAGTAYALEELGMVNIRQGAYAIAERYATESRALFETLGNRDGLGRALILLGIVAGWGFGDFPRALGFYQQVLALYQELGDRYGIAMALNNLGEIARCLGNYDQALSYYRQSGTISAEIGARLGILYASLNLGHTVTALGNDGEARTHYHEALRLAIELRMPPLLLDGLVGLAGVWARAGHSEQALAWLGLALDHPALISETRPMLDTLLADLRAKLSAEAVEAGLERGQALNLEAVVREILAGED